MPLDIAERSCKWIRYGGLVPFLKNCRNGQVSLLYWLKCWHRINPVELICVFVGT